MIITVYGDPRPKGSLRCVGSTHGRRHVLIESNRTKLQPWRDKIKAAGIRARQQNGGTLDGPITIAATFTIGRPTSVSKLERPWPTTRSSGDIDKLTRTVLDALDDAGLYGDDSEVVALDVFKCYPDTYAAPDRLDRPGVIIRIQGIRP